MLAIVWQIIFVRSDAQSLSGPQKRCCDHYSTWLCLDQSHTALLLFDGIQDYTQCAHDLQVCFVQILSTFRLIVLMNVLIHKHVP